MASGADTQTDIHAHIPTREPKQFQETRRARPSAVRAWFKNALYSSLKVLNMQLIAHLINYSILYDCIRIREHQ